MPTECAFKLVLYFVYVKCSFVRSRASSFFYKHKAHICYSVCLCKFVKWMYEILWQCALRCCCCCYFHTLPSLLSGRASDVVDFVVVGAESWARHKFIQHLLCGTNKMIINKLFIHSQVFILH